jgi:Core-2/I-Branching enzyme
MTYSPTAFLILAHTWPQQLARLVQRLDAPGWRSFVHVDRKVDIAPFRDAAPRHRNCSFLDRDRVAVRWGAFSVVDATLNLIAEARRAMPEAERFCLLSGADYPIRSQAEIAAAFASGRDFIKINGPLDPRGNGSHDENVRYPFWGDIELFNPRSSPVPPIERIANRVSRLMPRTPPAGFRFFHGSCWWSLTRDTIEDVLAETEREPRLRAWFRRVKIADEIFFPSFVRRVRPGPRDEGPAERNLHGAHYIDWTTPNPTRPKVLELDDLATLARSSALFARKLDPQRSAALMDALDRRNAPDGAAAVTRPAVPQAQPG